MVPPLYAAIRGKLQKADIDQEIKECSIVSMANFISFTYKSLSAQQISEVVEIYKERLANDLTRDASLKSIAKIARNSGSKDRAIIPIGNVAVLMPKMFELLHKAQRTIHLNTLEALAAMLSRYPAQFSGVSGALLKELAPFINDSDMQASALALKAATATLPITAPSSAETQAFVANAVKLSQSGVI